MRKRKEKRKQEKLNQQYEKKLDQKTDRLKVSVALDENVKQVKKVLGDSPDIVARHIQLESSMNRRAVVVYLDEMVNKDLTHDYIIRPLMTVDLQNTTDVWQTIQESIVQGGEVKEVSEFKSIIDGILSGDTIVFVDGFSKGLVIGSKGWTTSTREPRSESVIRGPRESMSETLVFSVSMVRHRLRDPDLRIKNFTIGKRTKTDVQLLYIEGLTDHEVIDEVVERLNRIVIDGVLESGYLEELIQDQTWSPFPQIQNTERPDSVVGHLLEGKFAIMVDGTPHALIAPAVFTQFYYSPEDYYERYLVSSFLRWIRLLSLFTALLAPALYISFVSFHPEMVPSRLMLAIAAGRSTVPFPSIIEALLMEISVEILREASVRLPGPIGPTIGIVGALVIGETAVAAGLVSPLMVIVVGITTISSYANPSYNAAISVRLLRFPLMLFAAILGIYGIMLGLVVILLHLVQLRSFGVPYTAPYAPLNLSDLRDSLIRMPWKWMNQRPSIYRPQQSKREKGGGS